MKRVGIMLSALAVAWQMSPACSADLEKIDRTILREPKYTSRPCYALLVFGPKAEKRFWIAVDGDALYVDRNGNGDLTEPGERVPLDVEATKKMNLAPGAYKGMNVFDIGQVEGVRLRLDFWVRDESFIPQDDFYKRILKERAANDWENATLWRIAADGSKAQNPVLLSRRPKDAQISHLAGPLTFQIRLADRLALQRGPGGVNFEVLIGSPGIRARNSGYPVFSPLTVTEVPADVHPLAQFEFPNKIRGEAPIKLEVPLNHRC
jgi:hypothetical protein